MNVKAFDVTNFAIGIKKPDASASTSSKLDGALSDVKNRLFARNELNESIVVSPFKSTNAHPWKNAFLAL